MPDKAYNSSGIHPLHAPTEERLLSFRKRHAISTTCHFRNLSYANTNSEIATGIKQICILNRKIRIIRDRTWIKNTQKSTNAPDQFQFSHNFRIAIQSHESALYFLLSLPTRMVILLWYELSSHLYTAIHWQKSHPTRGKG